jgi:hypothetical protein
MHTQTHTPHQQESNERGDYHSIAFISNSGGHRVRKRDRKLDWKKQLLDHESILCFTTSFTFYPGMKKETVNGSEQRSNMVKFGFE